MKAKYVKQKEDSKCRIEEYILALANPWVIGITLGIFIVVFSISTYTLFNTYESPTQETEHVKNTENVLAHKSIAI